MPDKISGRTFSEWLELGNKCFKEKEFQKAIEYYEKAVEDPENSVAWSNMGVAYENLGNSEKEVECCKKAVEKAEELALKIPNSFIIVKSEVDAFCALFK